MDFISSRPTVTVVENFSFCFLAKYVNYSKSTWQPENTNTRVVNFANVVLSICFVHVNIELSLRTFPLRTENEKQRLDM